MPPKRKWRQLELESETRTVASMIRKAEKRRESEEQLDSRGSRAAGPTCREGWGQVNSSVGPTPACIWAGTDSQLQATIFRNDISG